MGGLRVSLTPTKQITPKIKNLKKLKFTVKFKQRLYRGVFNDVRFENLFTFTSSPTPANELPLFIAPALIVGKKHLAGQSQYINSNYLPFSVGGTAPYINYRSLPQVYGGMH